MTSAPGERSHTTSTGWIRATKSKPCPICNHTKYCGKTRDGAIVNCTRISAGSFKRSKNGYLHRVGPSQFQAGRTFIISDTKPVRNDLPILAKQFQTAVIPSRLQRFAGGLGLSVESLQRLGIGFARATELHRLGTPARSCCFTFPMFDHAGHVVGFRLRTDSGFKFSLTGGHEGLFIPCGAESVGRVFITEGPTDCAALLDLGFNAIGRPSCAGGGLFAEGWICARAVSVVIFADSDQPGQDGARDLAGRLALGVHDVRVVIPPEPFKDIRAWKLAGAKAADVERIIANAAPSRIVIRGAR